ncbi:MAG: ATP-grasp domain-containing protein [Acidobacteria bacterium]|nr:MAG: ATP-grasp domain-containing protein [Acidobacteriota bacterium]
MTDRPRLLLLMTTSTYKAEAFVTAAARCGVALTVGTDRPQALAAADPQGHLVLPFGESRRAVAKIAAFARRTRIDGVLAADDDGVLLAAEAAAALGLRHAPAEAVRRLRFKHLFRRAVSEAGLPSARWRLLAPGEDAARAARRLTFPVVVKPVALSASRGVVRADDPAGFVRAVSRIRALLNRAELSAGRQPLLVESYLDGPEVALEGVVRRGRLRTLALFDKPRAGQGPFFEESIYVLPSGLTAEAQEGCRLAVERALGAVGFHTGNVHAELRIVGGLPHVIEIAPRSIGGLCSRVVRFRPGGTPLEELVIRSALGMDVEGFEPEPGARGVMMIPIPAPGILRGWTGEAKARLEPGIEGVRITVPPGAELEPPPEGDRYLGFLFARGASPPDVVRSLERAHSCLRFEIEPLRRGQAAAGMP